jgi:hypothetical protein
MHFFDEILAQQIIHQREVHQEFGPRVVREQRKALAAFGPQQVPHGCRVVHQKVGVLFPVAGGTPEATGRLVTEIAPVAPQAGV